VARTDSIAARAVSIIGNSIPPARIRLKRACNE
jgi:hypothetical protein